MDKTKQVILVRRDLAMPPGKLAAQVAHASLGAILPHMSYLQCGYRNYRLNPSKNFAEADAGANLLALIDWLNNSFTKVCLGVMDLEHLMKTVEMGRRAGLNPCVINDDGRTVFNGIETVTCAAFTPTWREQIDKVTGHLRLY